MASALAAEIHSWHWFKRGLVFVGLGAAMALGQAPTDWPIVTVFAFGAALYLMSSTSGHRRMAWHGWGLGLGYFAVSLRWIVSPFLVHIERDGWMAPFALILMAAGFALFWALAAWCAGRFLRGSLIGIALAIVAAEVTRSLILTGFPWALIGHVLVPTPLAQLASFGGPHLLSLLVAMMACFAALLMDRKPLGIVGLAVVVLVGFGMARYGPSLPEGDGPIVRLVQPNAPQEQKWDPVMSHVFFNRMLDYTGADDVPDLVVWPESAIAMLLNNADEALGEISDAARGAPVVLGVNRRDGRRYFNSFVLLGRGGLVDALYDKQHIVPFGEYVPGGEMLAALGFPGFASSMGGGFSNGEGLRTLEIPGLGPIRPLICYEGIFAEEVESEQRPRAMILITNDAWFGKGAGPFQHLAQARLRAIEQGLPMVRVANTGVSAMIDSFGQITASIPLNEAGFVDAVLPEARPATVYTQLGDFPVKVLLIIALLSLWLRCRWKSVDPNGSDA